MAVIPIRSDIDILKARRVTREVASEMDFNTSERAAIETTVSELASNIVKHSKEGTISIEYTEGGLKIVSEDQGPGIEDLGKALKGQIKSLAGLGIGLSGVKRLMDQVDIESEKGKGTRIVAWKWKVKPSLSIKPRPKYNVPREGLMQYGVISIPALGAEHNGDAFVIREFDQKILIAVIDGLGHGEGAHAVSHEAATYIQKNYMHDLSAIIENCHKVLRRTRGGVMGLLRVDLERSILAYSGVGNIGIKIIGKKPARPVSMPGIVGHNFRKLLVEEFPYIRGDTIFMYSDGISDMFNPDKLELKGKSPQNIAEEVAGKFGIHEDDNTIVIAREES